MLLEKKNQSLRQRWSVLPGKMPGQVFCTLLRNGEGRASLLFPMVAGGREAREWAPRSLRAVSGALTSVGCSAWRGGNVQL